MTVDPVQLKAVAKHGFDELVSRFTQLRAQKAALRKQHEEALAPFDVAMGLLEAALHKKLSDSGQQSAKTEHGTAYFYTDTTANIVDFDALWEFIRENDRPELLQRRLTLTEVKSFIEAHPDVPVPGVRVETSQTVRVKK